MTERGPLAGTARVQVAAQLLDLSEGGALLGLAAALDVGTIHDFALDLGSGETLWVQGEVRRSAAVDGGGYRVGVEFVGIDPHDQRRLREYLAERR